MIKNVLITGITGYIGTELAKELCRIGYNVHGVVRRQSNLKVLEPIQDSISIHTYEGDIESLNYIVKKSNPDIIIHLAGLYISEHKSEQIDLLLQSNITFGVQLLEASVKNKVKYFINTGTHWQKYKSYHDTSVNLYAATKEAFSSIANFYVDFGQMSMITLKLIDTYGPFDSRNKIINLLKNSAINNEVLEMSPGGQEIGLVYIEDVVKAFILAMKELEGKLVYERKTYVVAPENIYTLKEVANTFTKVSQLELPIRWGKKSYRSREVMKIEMQHPNILKDYKRVSLEEGIKRILVLENLIENEKI